MIFDECHRSQFGEMHTRITKKFKNYHIFGFTGTPIFAVNAGSGKFPHLKTTAQAFGGEPDEKGNPTKTLHAYTIVDAINDANVLPFRIDYVNTIKTKDGVKDKKVKAIDRESALMAPDRISEVVTYILEHFDQKTKRRESSYTFSKLINIKEVAKDGRIKEEKEKKRLNGFNSIFAVSSIEAAKLYYTEFKKQMSVHPNHKLNIATIYSYGQNEEDPDGFIDDENSDDTNGLDKTSREFLESAIEDYNGMFGTAYDTSADKFPNYYKDLSLRMKNKEIDLLIVVNMFLTGFDATTLNTLWVDKNLKQHGLIQAFSRTNRILNSVKTFGNIICFRDLQEATDAAIALFGDKDASGIVLLKSYNDYYYGYTDNKGKYQKGYKELIAELRSKYPLGKHILGEEAKKYFIVLFGNILRVRNILSTFDDFEGNEILSPREFQDYTGIYIDLRPAPSPNTKDENIADDVVFEMELVKQIEVNVDYILMLVAKYHESNSRDKDVLVAIDKAIRSSFELRSKKELIERFIETINVNTDVQRDWAKFVKEQKETDLENLIAEEKLKADETLKFVTNAFRDGVLKTTGTDIDKILPSLSRFGEGGRAHKKQTVIDKLKAFFEKYFGLESDDFSDNDKKAVYGANDGEFLMVAEEAEKYGDEK